MGEVGWATVVKGSSVEVGFAHNQDLESKRSQYGGQAFKDWESRLRASLLVSCQCL